MYYLLVIAAFMWERTRSLFVGPRARTLRLGERRAKAVAIAAVAALVVLFAVQLALLVLAARNESVRPDLARLPIRVVLDQRGAPIIPALVRYAYLFCAFAQSAALAFFVAAWRQTRSRRTLAPYAAAGSLVMVLAALAAPAISSSDIYAYAGYGILGAGAYTPPATRFPGTLDAINHWYGSPMLPSAYGPVWLRLDAFVTSFGPTLVAKLAALRIFSAFVFGLAIAALAWMRMPLVVVVAFALDPAVIYQYVACAHNDLVAVTLVFFAIALVRRAGTAGVVVAALGASVKVPLTIPALFAALPLKSRLARTAFVGGVTAGAVAVAIWGGAPYAHALHAIAALYVGEEPPFTKLLHAIVLAIAAGGAVAAIWSRRMYPSAAFAYASLGVTLYPWYIGWGLPYAVRRPPIARDLLVAFPAAAALATGPFVDGAVLAEVVIAIAVAFALRVRDAQRSSKSR